MNGKFLAFWLLALGSLFVGVAFWYQWNVAQTNIPVLKWSHKPGEATQEVENAGRKAFEALTNWVESKESQLEAFERILSEYSEAVSAPLFLAHVTSDQTLAKEYAGCEEKTTAFHIKVFSNEGFFEKIRRDEPKNDAEQVLKRELLEGFESSGVQLPVSVREVYKAKLEKLEQLKTQYHLKLAQDQPVIQATESELEGVPARLRETFKKEKQHFLVALTPPVIPELLKFAHSEAFRKRVSETAEARGGQENLDRLNEALKLRRELAGLLGAPTWASFKLKHRMAKHPEAVADFLKELQGRIQKRFESDMARLSKRKGQRMEPWDIAYYAEKLKEEQFKLDPEKVRAFFPANKVVEGMFQVYGQLLGLSFEPAPTLPVWAPDVRGYSIRENGETRAYFFTDFYPREGKYGHAAAFTLRSGRKLPDGVYQLPISAIVANFAAPVGDTPSLLSYQEVVTLFHEFGHIMHQTLTKAPFASISGTQVAWDFVEAPSQMFENWVEHPEVLEMISGHYQDTKKTLPSEEQKKLIAASHFLEGFSWMRQLLFATFDLRLHTEDIEDALSFYKGLHKSFMGYAPVKTTFFPSQFGHVMGGYDAGYYGYAWSKVFAEDLFSKFQEEGILNEELGFRFRTEILAPGKLHEPHQMMERFLGRPPGQKAFIRKLEHAS